MLTENSLVAVVGGGGGLWLAYAGVRTPGALSGRNLPQAGRIRIDEFAILDVMLTADIAGLVAGLPPEWQLAAGHHRSRSLLTFMRSSVAREIDALTNFMAWLGYGSFGAGRQLDAASRRVFRVGEPTYVFWQRWCSVTRAPFWS